jgi:hypothetical protein
MKYKEPYEYIKIYKPIHSTYVGIYDARVNRAIRRGVPLKIEIPQGIGYHDPVEWKKTGKIIYKTYLFPDRPMKEICNYVKVGKPLTEAEKAAEQYRKYGV